MKYKRFCCWCGKVEYTKNCKSKSLQKAVKQLINWIKRGEREKNEEAGGL